jgi:hypothetical protein
MEKVRIVDIEHLHNGFYTYNIKPVFQIDELVLDDFYELVLCYTALQMGYVELDDNDIVYTQKGEDAIVEYERKEKEEIAAEKKAEAERQTYLDTVVDKFQATHSNVKQVLQERGYIFLKSNDFSFRSCFYHPETKTFYDHIINENVRYNYLTIKNRDIYVPVPEQLKRIHKYFPDIFRKQKINDFLNSDAA